MKVVYASRTGNVESIISKLGIEDALKIEDGSETVEEDYILFTYTDEQYNVPCLYKVENDGSDEDIEAIKKVIA